jgi:hypothetical protein
MFCTSVFDGIEVGRCIADTREESLRSANAIVAIMRAAPNFKKKARVLKTWEMTQREVRRLNA